MKKIFYLMIGVCLMTPSAFGSDAAWITDNIRLDQVAENYVEPDLGTKVGKIDMVQGKAIIVHAGNPQAYWIREEYALFKGDTVITLKKSRIRFQLNDGSILTLASETRLVINQSVYDPDTQSRSSFMSMAVGKARFVVQKIQNALQSDFKIKTQTAVVGVRGSDFIVEADHSMTKVVTLDDTRLEIISLADPNMEQTVLKEYEKIEVGENAMPSVVESVSIEDAKQIMREMDMTPVVPDKLQVEAEKPLRGIQKDTFPAVPEKIKEDIKAAAVEKTEVRQAIAPEKIRADQAEKFEMKVTEAARQYPLRAEVKAEIQGIAKENAEIIKTDLIEKVEIKAAEILRLESAEKSDIRLSETLQSEIIQQPEVVRAAVADIVRENRETIQQNIVEIKKQSAQDISGKEASAMAGTTSSIKAPLSEQSNLSGSSVSTSSSSVSGQSVTEPDQTVIEKPVSDDVIVTFTPPSQLEKPIRETEITLPSDTPASQSSTTPLPDETKPTEMTDNSVIPQIPTVLTDSTEPLTLTDEIKPAAHHLPEVIQSTTPSEEGIKQSLTEEKILPDGAKPTVRHLSNAAISTPLSDGIKPTLPDDSASTQLPTVSDTTLPKLPITDTAKENSAVTQPTTFLPDIQTQLPRTQ